MAQRRSIRDGCLRVIHRHQAGARHIVRISELAFVQGVPKAVLEWIDLGGVPAPLYLCDLDPGRLKASPTDRRTYYYDGETTDPRYEPVGPAGNHAGPA